MSVLHPAWHIRGHFGDKEKVPLRLPHGRNFSRWLTCDSVLHFTQLLLSFHSILVLYFYPVFYSCTVLLLSSVFNKCMYA